MLLLRMLAWGEGSSGRLQDWVGQDAESPPLIRQTLPAWRRRPSPKSPGDVLPLFLRHEARQSTPSLPTWFPSVRVWEKAGVGFDWPLGLFASFPNQKIQWVGWIMAHITTMDVSGFPSLGRHSRPSRNMSHGRHQIQQRRRHFTSAGPARRYAWRPRPQPAARFNKMPLSNLAGRPTPTTDHDASEDHHRH